MKTSLSPFPKRKLGDLCEINIGKTPSRSKAAYWGGDHPWLSIADMNQGRRLWHTKEAITDAGIKASGIRIVPEGTLLLSYKLSIGKVGITERSLFTNEAIAALPVVDPSVLRVDYLYWTLNTIDLLETSDRAAMGATLNKAKLKEVQIPLPPLAEQKRIAGILDAADALRAKRREALAQLDALLQSSFLTLFGDPVSNPMGWKAVPLRSVADLENGDRSSNYPSGPDILDSGVLFLSTKNISDNQLVFNNCQFISEKKFKSLSRGKLRRNDLVITLRGTLGSCAIFACGFETGFINAQILILRPSDKIASTYLHALIITEQMRRHFEELSTGVAVKQLTGKQIGDLLIPLPPLPLQQKFAAIVESIERQKTTQRAHLAELDALFAALQHHAFRGEL
jgi:type I restriction enzyme, S subunit